MKKTITFEQLSRLIKESDDPEKGEEVFVIDVLDLTGMEDEDESEIPDTIYSETFDDEDEAWNKAEELVEQYKDKEGKFEVFVNAGIYRTPDGDEDSTDMYSIFYMLSGTEGYQGHINMVESKSKKRVKESARDKGESVEMSAEIADEAGVVAAECCFHCSNYLDEGPVETETSRYMCDGKCSRLKCWTFATDVCKHYHGKNED